MNRSPLYYPLNRGGDLEAGGAADLQTDIMRFMAILSLCLVAVFALVQSIPLQPTTVETSTAPSPETAPIEAIKGPLEAPVVPPPEPQPRERSAAPLAPPPKPAWREPVEARIALPPKPRSREAAESAVAPPPGPGPRERLDAPIAPPPAPPSRELAATPGKETPPPTPEAPVAQRAAAAAAAPVENGFTLRFESDAALTRLVARNEVGLYAISPGRSLRMSVNRGAYAFWPASVPNQYHEMEPGTVPAAVAAALRRSGALDPEPGVQWGVTLPAGMRRQLDTYLAGHSSGALVIEASGNLRLEP